MSIELHPRCADGFTRHAHVESMTTAEEFASYVLSDKGVPETSGWTVSLDEGDASIELNGGDFLLDAIGEMELPPAFPASSPSGHFLLTRDRSRGQLPLLINTGPHNNPAHQYRYERQARSQDRLATEDFGLSHSSALNERYFGEKESSRKGKAEGKDSNKSKSLDNLLGQDNAFGLSESRLNQRYRGGGGGGGGQTELSPEDLEMESISQRGGRRERWDDVGLDQQQQQRGRSKGSDRYFSQPDLVDKASPTNKSPSHQREAGKARSQTNMTRLVDADYPAGSADGALSKGGRSRLHGHPKHVKGQFRKGEKYNRSSAMSDTSEAPSIASHVRRVRVPSQVCVVLVVGNETRIRTRIK